MVLRPSRYRLEAVWKSFGGRSELFGDRVQAMYKFLGVDFDHKPRYEMQKVNEGAETWLANYDRLKTLVETKDPCTVVLDERLANLDADGDELPQLEVTIGGGDAREAELGCATSPPPPVTPCPPPAVCPICPVTTECDECPVCRATECPVCRATECPVCRATECPVWECPACPKLLAASPSSPSLLPFVALFGIVAAVAGGALVHCMVSRKRLPLEEQDGGPGSREGEEEDDKGDEEEPAERRTAAARHAPKRGPHDASSGRDQRGVRKAELAMLRASDQP